MNINHFSIIITAFQGRTAPEQGWLVGYGTIIEAYKLSVPVPEMLALVSQKHKQYKTNDWTVFTLRHRPEDSLPGHLSFALKYEGIDLLVLKKLFEKLEDGEIIRWIRKEPTSMYSRKIWFLYEWLMEIRLDLPDLTSGNYVELVDTKNQYASGIAENSKRQRIRNNLPGQKEFCPMLRKTLLLEEYTSLGLSEQVEKIIRKIHPDVMARTASFLLLKDSKASYAIEGERPPQNRAQRWGRAIGQAGQKKLTKEELIRLQQIVVDNPRFTRMGFRKEEGFIGEYDRRLGSPIPDHISARWKDLDSLLEGLIRTTTKLEQDKSFDAVLAAALIAFGFVFIHPFTDGNGRIHRYLVHHLLLRKEYVSKGFIFPVSAIILDRIDEYRKVLETFSEPRQDLIEWKPNTENNVEVLNETIDLYRYFDATRQAEFLYSCVKIAIEKTIPEEAKYLEQYDRMKGWLEDHFEMPDKLIATMVRFLEQGEGKLSQRAREKEFIALSEVEVLEIETKFREIFFT